MAGSVDLSKWLSSGLGQGHSPLRVLVLLMTTTICDCPADGPPDNLLCVCAHAAAAAACCPWWFQGR